MHDLDRTQLEIGDSFETDFDAEATAFEEPFEFDTEFDDELVMDEAMEMELAAELLAVTSDQELDQFLGKWLKSAARGVKKFVRSPVGRALGGVLKGVAKKALPIAGTAIGTFFGGPAGAAIGGKLGSLGAGLIKEMELEGIPQEEYEFEIARRIVRIGTDAARRLASVPHAINPVAAAHKAVAEAAKKVLPALSGSTGQRHTYHGRSGKTGRWVRSGRNIILLRA